MICTRSLPMLILSCWAQSTSAELEKRATSTSAPVLCGLWDTTSAGPYTLQNNLWGVQPTINGSQCTTLTSYKKGAVGWQSVWSWTGSGVKSYANIGITGGVNKQLSKIKSMPVSRKPASVFG